jgi:cytochrome P450
MEERAVSQPTERVVDDDLPSILRDLGSPQFRVDPYPYYRRLREREPVCRTPDRWLLTRYRDCDGVLRDPRWAQVSEDRFMCLPDRSLPDPDSGDGGRPVGDQPHNPGYLRRFLAAELAPERLHQLEPRVQEIVEGLLDGMVEAGDVDLVDTFAGPLPTLVICDLFGVPIADRDLVRTWSNAIVERVDAVAEASPEVIARGDRARVEFRDYFRDLIADRRRQPGDDLISSLLAYEEGAHRLSEEELLDALIFIHIAGHGAPTELMGLGTLALSRHPEELDRWRADPGIARSGVEELLRYDAPSQITGRVALEDVQLDGSRIPRGEIALVLLGAANRDPEAFADPDRLDLTRQPNRHLGFGQGPHYCAGAPLGRLELSLAFNSLLRRAPRLEVSGNPEYRSTLAIRGLTKLPVRLR